MLDTAQQPMHHRRRTWMPGVSTRNLVVDGATGLALAVAMVALFIFAPGGSWARPGEIAALLMAASVASAIRFEVGAGWSSPMQIAQVPLWFAVPPAWLPVFVAISLIAGQAIESERAGVSESRLRAVLAVDDSWHAVGAAAALAVVGPPSVTVDGIATLGLVFAGQIAADAVYSVVHDRLTTGLPIRTLLGAWLMVSAVDAALLPVGVLAALVMANEPWLALTLLPLLALFAEFAREREERVQQAIELSGAYRGTAQLMASVLGHDDPYTGGEHTLGVVELAGAVGLQLGLSARQLNSLEFGALLHDIGKIEIPNEIINKPGKLTDAEWALIREHPAIGQRMLDTVGGALTETGLIVRAHHERFDGTGYPDGLRGEAIPLEARIITVCDSFSAMTTDRSYRRALSHREAVAELDRCSGSQFDPTVVTAMHRVLADGRQLVIASRALRGVPELTESVQRVA